MSGSEARARALRDYLSGRRDAMVELLVGLTYLESPTDVPEAQHPVQERLAEALERCGYAVRRIPGRATGGHLYARPAERPRDRPAQLLIGHTDTVWPVGTLASMPVVVENGCVRGPGSFDMKAGLVQGVFALEALRALELEPPVTPVFFMNSDEEVGSPESRRWVRLLAKRVVRTWVLEPAYGPEGRLKTARKGIVRFRILVRGKPAHAGLDPTAGASAIGEMALVVQRLHAMTDLERGITVNVGTIRGGTRPNVIAAEAVAEVDVRISRVADAAEIERAVRALRPSTPGTSIHVEGGLSMPPLERTERNRALWLQAVDAGRRLGLELGEYTSGGGSDGNTTSQYTATLDGLGAVGDGAHALHEGVMVAGMVERAALLAELLMSPANAPA
ncbi:MAG TPA: M20 family metallopeptidase [Longimicrobiales bacterium]|nr:M20 family metallopeptidase [Longimicrobiales bacterium]